MCLDEIIGCLRLHISKTTKKVDEKKAENWKKKYWWGWLCLFILSHSLNLIIWERWLRIWKKKHADRVGGASSVWDFETTISNYFSQLFHKSGLAMIMTDHYFVI